MGCQMEQFFFAHFLRMGGSHLEHPFGQGTGLIKNHRLNLGERFQIVRSFHKDARLARAADAGEETQGNTDNQRAGTGNNEERKRPVNPHIPVSRHPHESYTDKRRNEGKSDRRRYHGRSIYTGKFGNKIFRF